MSRLNDQELLAEFRAWGDQMQSEASRLLDYATGTRYSEMPYEVRLAASSVEVLVREWSALRMSEARPAVALPVAQLLRETLEVAGKLYVVAFGNRRSASLSDEEVALINKLRSLKSEAHDTIGGHP